VRLGALGKYAGGFADAADFQDVVFHRIQHRTLGLETGFDQPTRGVAAIGTHPGLDQRVDGVDVDIVYAAHHHVVLQLYAESVLIA